MNFFSIFMGWNWRVQRTRRKWDRLREHSLDKKGRVRNYLLRELDLLEDKVKNLEEENLTRRDRVRIMKEVEAGLENLQDVLEHGESLIQDTRRPERHNV
jgi:hypothetical protein